MIFEKCPKSCTPIVVSMYLYVCIGSLLAPNQYNTQCSRVAWTNNNIELLARKVENAIQ